MFNFVTNMLAELDKVTNTVNSLTKTITTIASSIFGLATLGMIGLAIFLAYKMFTAEDDSKRKNAKGQLIYAIIGIVVLIVLLILTPIITSAITNAAQGSSVRL